MSGRQEFEEIRTVEWGSVSIAAADLDLLSEQSGLPRDACIERLRDYRLAEMADEWRESAPRTAAEVREFYSRTDGYLWELLGWNATSEYRDRYMHPLERLAELWPPDKHPLALDYGAGIGSVALRLAELGYRVTIADVPGRTLSFARARLERMGVPYEVREIIGDAPRLEAGRWNVVVCFDVLEHVPDPGAVARTLARAVRDGGGAAIKADFATGGTLYPHHLPQGRTRFSDHRWTFFLRSLGLAGVDRSIYRRLGRPRRSVERLRYGLWRATGIYARRVER
jgi:SAM-dependent methyltransferase